MIDTHAHLYDECFNPDRPAVIARAKAAGVSRVFLPNCELATIDGMLQLEEDFPGVCYPMMGLHPCYVKENFEDELRVMEGWISRRPFAAIGEIGLDFYWDKTHVPQQRTAFGRQMDWALQIGRPIVIHSREATRECIDMVEEKQNGALRGIFHCFSGTLEDAKRLTDLGFCLGIGGVITYKKTNLREIVRAVGLSALVLETDAPYLSPTPHRGKRNESSYLPLVAAAIASSLEVAVETVSAATTKNAEKIFAASLSMP